MKEFASLEAVDDEDAPPRQKPTKTKKATGAKGDPIVVQETQVPEDSDSLDSSDEDPEDSEQRANLIPNLEEPPTNSALPSDPEEAKIVENQEILFKNNARFLRDALIYCQLRTSVRKGDVGAMEDLIPALAFMFKGGNHSKYAIQMLETYQLLKHEYSSKVK